MSSQDEVFGLPFLFTGGLPNSLDKFTEGNLRCFLIYLIEVVGKANRQNVWQIPSWWNSKLIPYSPIKVNTSSVPPEQIVKELRGLVESCYRFYRAEKILEVSRQLAEIPRILLGIRDNGDNTMTVYDTNSKAVYVTVRPENLYYDAHSLGKVSKDWRSNYTKEDVSFCQIKKGSKLDKHNIDEIQVIELSDSDSDGGRSETKEKILPKAEKLSEKSNSVGNIPTSKSNMSQHSMGVVVKSGKDYVIELSDSDEEKPVKREVAPVERRPGDWGKRLSLGAGCNKDKDVQFVGVYSGRPCPKRFKKPSQNLVPSNIIVLSDSDDDIPSENPGMFVTSYSSPAKDYSTKYFMESPSRHCQKSILGPLIRSSEKVAQPSVNVSGVKKGNDMPAKARKPNRMDSSDEEDLLRPTKEQLFLLKKKNRTFYRESPKHESRAQPRPTAPKPPTQTEFMRLLGLCHTREAPELARGLRPHVPRQALLTSGNRSLRHSLSRMPLDWIRSLVNSNYFIMSKRSSRTRYKVPSSIDYEPYCSTDRTFVLFSLKAAYSTTVGKEGRSVCRSARRGESGGLDVEKWVLQTEEGSQRRKRAALRMLRSMTLSPEEMLQSGTLAPLVVPLPSSLVEYALHSTVNIKKPFLL